MSEIGLITKMEDIYLGQRPVKVSIAGRIAQREIQIIMFQKLWNTILN